MVLGGVEFGAGLVVVLWHQEAFRGGRGSALEGLELVCRAFWISGSEDLGIGGPYKLYKPDQDEDNLGFV